MNKLFKPSSSNRMNIMQPHIQQEQQRQQGHFPSTNSNNDIVSLFYIYIKGWVSAGFTRVDRVSPGQLPDEFLLRPGPVPGPGRPAGPVQVSKLCWKHLFCTGHKKLSRVLNLKPQKYCILNFITDISNYDYIMYYTRA